MDVALARELGIRLTTHVGVLPDKVAVTLNDERWVDPPDPASNAQLVSTRLLTGRAAGSLPRFQRDPRALNVNRNA